MSDWTRYPWRSLERVPRSSMLAQRAAREALDGAWGREHLSVVLTEVLGVQAKFLGVQLRALAHRPARTRGACALFKTSDGLGQVLLEIEPELAAQLTSLLLHRPAAMIDPAVPIPHSIQGAVAALVLAVARRVCRHDRLSLHAIGSAARNALATMQPNAVCIDATLLLGDEAFELSAIADVPPRPTRAADRFDLASLSTLASLPLPLEMVVAATAALPEEVESIRPGDAFLPGDGWWVTRSESDLAGRVVLCAAGGTLGIPVNLLCDGKIVVLEGTMTVDADNDAPPQESESIGSSADALAEAPLVVRVELGQVSMTAREWAALRPGDVITTGRRIAERAVLRIAGRAVATGELVDVDGELGVRIHERVGQHNGGAS